MPLAKPTPFLLRPSAIVLALLYGWAAAASAGTDLLISEYVEGSSDNKALEFYNASGSPIDLTAGGYQVQMFFNLENAVRMLRTPVN